MRSRVDTTSDCFAIGAVHPKTRMVSRILQRDWAGSPFNPEAMAGNGGRWFLRAPQLPDIYAIVRRLTHVMVSILNHGRDQL